MPTLKSRIEQLEKQSAPASENRVWLVRLVAMGDDTDKPLNEITHNGQTWHRQSEESEDDFEARVKAEVFPDEGETGVILITS